MLVDLRRVSDICRERRVALVFGEYWSTPAWVDESVNDPIAQVAVERSVPLVPLTARMRGLVAEFGHDRVLTGDFHASAVGNREVARQVLATLVDAALVEPRAEWDDLPPLERLLERPTLFVESPQGRAVSVELIGMPRALYSLRLDAVCGKGTSDPVTQPITGSSASSGAAVLPQGRIGRFGSSYARVRLPTDVQVPDGWHLIGWRIYAELRAGSGTVERTNTVELHLAQ